MSVQTGPTSERLARAREAIRLRATGLTVSDIARRLDVSRSYAFELCVDPNGAKARERKRRYGGTCVVCGKATDGSQGRRLAPKYCIAHISQSPEHIAAKTKWPASRVIAAIRWWADEYGEPPAMTDWNPYQARVMHDEARALRGERAIAAGAVPGFTTVVDLFGSWSAGIKAAGFTPRAAHGGGENALRRRDSHKTHCKRGHEFTEENTYMWGPRRFCRACRLIRERGYEAKRRAKRESTSRQRRPD